MKFKIFFGFLTFYSIYELRKFYIKVKTRILFEQLWEYILTQQVNDPVEFQKMIEIIRPSTID